MGLPSQLLDWSSRAIPGILSLMVARLCLVQGVNDGDPVGSNRQKENLAICVTTHWKSIISVPNGTGCQPPVENTGRRVPSHRGSSWQSRRRWSEPKIHGQTPVLTVYEQKPSPMDQASGFHPRLCGKKSATIKYECLWMNFFFKCSLEKIHTFFSCRFHTLAFHQVSWQWKKGVD